jgi:hypothetical protein
MDLTYIGISLALDQEKESGIELIFRFIETLKIQKFSPKLVKLLESGVSNLDRLLTDIEEKIGEEHYLIKRSNLILQNLGKSILSEETNWIMYSEERFKNLANYFKVFYDTLRYLESDKALATEHIDKLMSFLESDNRKNLIIVANDQLASQYKDLHLNHMDDNEIIQEISKNRDFVMKLKNSYLHKFDLSYFDDAKFILTEHNDDLRKKWDYQRAFHQSVPDREALEWEMLIKSGNKSLAEVGYLLWTIGSALENIEGVKVSVEDVGIGSIWFKVKVLFKDLIAKEETKEVLVKAREAAVSYLERPIAEVSKVKSEVFKLEKEAELNDQQIKTYDSSERKELELLNIESKKLELRQKAADIEGIELDNKKKKLDLITHISQIMASGIIQTDSLQININDVLYLIKEGNSINPGADINTIDNPNSDLL